jgi:hypothetical protein
LSRALLVDLASTFLRIEENAIAVAILLQAIPSTNFSRVQIVKLIDVDLQPRGDCFSFVASKPYESRFACATVAAVRAGKSQPIPVPNFIA